MVKYSLKQLFITMKRLQKRIRELAFLNKGISITLRDEREDVEQREDTYHYEGGIKSYVELLNENKEPIHEEPIYIHQTKDDVEIEIAMQYKRLCNELIILCE